MSTRELDRVKGRVTHYSACVLHLRILATELGRLVGSVEESAYDKRRPITDDFRALARELETVVECYGKAGVPLWQLVASSAYELFLRGELGDELFALN